MTQLKVRQTNSLSGRTQVPGDKSLSHRALILGAMAQGKNRTSGWLEAGDTLATLGAIRALGIEVAHDGTNLTFKGGTFSLPEAAINCANAGTAMRLLAGLMVGQDFASTLDGSEQLRKRPMKRIVTPLQAMGADITSNEDRPPLTIHPAQLRGIEFEMPVASAQVKSAVLLAGLQADGPTRVIEPGPSRDHTERMLTSMGASVRTEGRVVTIDPLNGAGLQPLHMEIPGDISSAAFLLVPASVLADSEVVIEKVGLNETRTGIIDVLTAMGAAITIENTRESGSEPIGDLRVSGTELRGMRIDGDLIVRAIDELPILAVAATQAEGETVIADAGELRVKEVDRISMLIGELRKLGAEIEEQSDGMIIQGPTRLKGARVSSHGDHRLGMALAVAGLLAEGETIIENAECIDDSFPGFAETLAGLGAEIGS